VTSSGERCATKEWARSLGGADAGETVFIAYIEGLSDRTVILDSVTVEVHGRNPPIHGSYLACVPLPYTLPTRSLFVNLDRDPATVTYWPGRDPRREPDLRSLRRRTAPEPFSFKLPKGEVEAFKVTALTGRCWCLWTLKLGYVVEGERHTVEVSDGGEPFATAARSPDSPVVSWDDGRWLDRSVRPLP
jgi:hypothetical protein